MVIRPLSFDAYRRLIQVAQHQRPASIWFKHARFLNVYTGQIDRAHIALAGERIAYVGDREPLVDAATEIISLDDDCLLAPGYIEPHAHPCQMYNPLSWGDALLQQGTVASINDNLSLMMLAGPQPALDFVTQLDALGPHLWLWWCSFDSLHVPLAEQPDALRAWCEHPLVVQGGELTRWPALLKGDVGLLRTLFELKQTFRKRVEGHLPGASRDTLNALAAAGIGADHEALDGADLLKRLRLGLHAAVRYSSIRPDLPQIIRQVADDPQLNRTRLFFTSDGPAPFFVERSSCAQMIRLAIEAGLPPVDAYRAATLNPATYYRLDEDLGGIAPGRLASLNVLRSLKDPRPLHVMQAGAWAVYDQTVRYARDDAAVAAWLRRVFPPRALAVRPQTASDQLQSTIGVELLNAVITRPYQIEPDAELSADECLLSLLDITGRWRVHTRLKGFVRGLLGLASTLSASTDVLVIGRDRAAMAAALDEALQLGGGIVALFADGARFAVPLPLSGVMSLAPIAILGAATSRFTTLMQTHGYPFDDPVYTLLFLTATHLPMVRVTRNGMYLVKEDRTIAPAVE